MIWQAYRGAWTSGGMWAHWWDFGCEPRVATWVQYFMCLTGNYRFELALGWFGNYDSYDLAALSLLSHGPPVRDHVCARRTSANASVALPPLVLLRSPHINRHLLSHNRLTCGLYPISTPAAPLPCSCYFEFLPLKSSGVQRLHRD